MSIVDPGGRLHWGVVVLRAALVALLSLALTVVATLVGVDGSGVTGTVLLRTVLVLAGLCFLLLLWARGDRTRGRGSPWLHLFLPSLVGFLANPAVWGGRALFAQLLVDPGGAAMVLDLVAWTLVSAALVAALGSRAVAQPERPAYG